MMISTIALSSRPADPQILARIEEKLKQVERFIDSVIDAHVVFRQPERENKKGAFTEIRLTLPDSIVFVREFGHTIESSLEEAMRSLKRQLLKYRMRKRARRTGNTK